MNSKSKATHRYLVSVTKPIMKSMILTKALEAYAKFELRRSPAMRQKMTPLLVPRVQLDKKTSIELLTLAALRAYNRYKSIQKYSIVKVSKENCLNMFLVSALKRYHAQAITQKVQRSG